MSFAGVLCTNMVYCSVYMLQASTTPPFATALKCSKRKEKDPMILFLFFIMYQVLCQISFSIAVFLFVENQSSCSDVGGMQVNSKTLLTIGYYWLLRLAVSVLHVHTWQALECNLRKFVDLHLVFRCSYPKGRAVHHVACLVHQL